MPNQANDNQDNENQDKPGRPLEQITRDGTSSVATVGAGGTGRPDGASTDEGYDEAVNTPWNATGSESGGGRTDDLLSPGTEADRNGNGFVSGERPLDPDATSEPGNSTGAGGGNRQSGETDGQAQSLSGEGRPSDPTGLQNAAGNEQPR